MTNDCAIVRDFIYLDIDKLYSLYSQLFEGVVDQIVESSAEGESAKNSQKGPPLQGKSLDSRVAAASVRTENKILLDHMYHRLEQRIAASLVPGNELSGGNIREELGRSFLVKATGSAEIEDYARMEVFLSKFNQIGEAIAYSAILRMDVASLREELSDLRQIGDRNDRKRAHGKARKLSPETLAKSVAAEMGLVQDKKMIENMTMLTAAFHGNAYEVTIVPCDAPGAVAFRGVLDKRWLRVSPDQLSALYGGFAEGNWTIVGSVTHLPGETMPEAEQSPEIGANEANPERPSNPSMRDPYRNMFRSARVFERMFTESNQRLEVTVSPVAIYRAMEVSVSRD